MKKGITLFYLFVLFIFIFSDYAEGTWPVYDAMNGALNSSQLATQEALLLTQQTQLSMEQTKNAKDEVNFIQQYIQDTQVLQTLITGAQWAQSTVKGIQDQLSFFNDVRNYIESIEDSITSVTDMYDTIQNAAEDIDKTKTRWNRLMKGNYNDIKGIKKGLSEAASLADNLDDHASQLENDAINVSQKARAHDKALDVMLRKAREINPLKAADPTVALLTKLELQQNVEMQRMFNEKMFKEDLEKLQKEKKRVESEKREKILIEDTADAIGKVKADKTEIIF